mgnify:CR=1 FL=1
MRDEIKIEKISEEILNKYNDTEDFVPNETIPQNATLLASFIKKQDNISVKPNPIINNATIIDHHPIDSRSISDYIKNSPNYEVTTESNRKLNSFPDNEYIDDLIYNLNNEDNFNEMKKIVKLKYDEAIIKNEQITKGLRNLYNFLCIER